MKKIFTTAQGLSKSLFFASILAATFASCSSSSDEMGDEFGANNEDVTEISLFSNLEGLTRGSEGETTTSSSFYVTGFQNETFEPGENLTVWINEADKNGESALYKAIPYTTADNNALTTTYKLFYPVSGNKVNVYAIHGNISNTITASETAMPSSFNFSVIADQSEKADYLKSDLIYGSLKDAARKSTSHEITFNHILSKVYFVINRGNGVAEGITVEKIAFKGVTLNGVFTPSNTNKLSAASSPTTGNVIVRLVDAEAEASTASYHSDAILVPQSLLGKTIEFTLSNNQVMSYTFPTSTQTDLVTTLESGKQYSYTVTLNLTGITLTSKIVGWTNTTGGSFDAGMSDAK